LKLLINDLDLLVEHLAGEAADRHAYQVASICAAILMPCSKKPRMIAARV
jgi:hypothetical protein